MTEDTHTRALEALCAQHGIPPPPDEWQGTVQPPSSVRGACRTGVEGEHENIALKPIFLADFAPDNAGLISARLRQRSMLLKPLNDPPLRGGSMRVTTALPEENWRFLEALRDVLTVS